MSSNIQLIEIQQQHKSNLIKYDHINAKNQHFKKMSPNQMENLPQFKKATCYKKIRKTFRFDTVQQKYGKYGPNCVIYFGLTVKLIIFCLIFSLIVGVAFLVLDSSQNCSVTQSCLSDSLAYRISLFNLINQVQYMFPQTIVWLIVSVIICLFMLHLRTYATKTYKRVNNRNITQADYSIIIRRIPQTATKSDILQLIQTQIKHQILAAFPQCQSKINQVLKVEEVIMLLKMDETNRSFEQFLEKFKNDIKDNQQRQPQISQIIQPSQFSGTAIVIFSSVLANDYIHDVKREKCFDHAITAFLPFIRARCQFTIGNKNVSISRAPQPSEILWNNIGYTQCNRIKRKFIFTLFTLLIIGISAVVTYGITFIPETNDKAITILQVIAIFIFNWAIQLLLDYAIQHQKIDNLTDETAARFHQIVFNQNINLGIFQIILPFLIKLPSIYDGLIQANFPAKLVATLLFYIVITIHQNFIVDYFKLKSKLMKFLIKNDYFTKTQHQAKQSTQGPQISFQSKYSDLVQLFWFGFIFSIVSPLCIFLSTIGLVFYYIYQRILYAKVYPVPAYTRIRIPTAFINSLQYVILHIGLVNFFLYLILAKLESKEMDPRILAVSLINIILGIIFVMMPWDRILQKCKYNIFSSEDQKSYRQNYPHFKTTYNSLNPAVTINLLQLADKVSKKQIISSLKNTNQDHNPQIIQSQRKLI